MWGYMDRDLIYLRGRPNDGGLLGLLKTCRQVYSEAIDILYIQNIFDVNHLFTPVHLSNTLLPYRFNSISSLQQSWFFKGYKGGPPLLLGEAPHDLNTWFSCRALANMQGLRDLRIEITSAWAHHDHVQVLTPLKSLQLNGNFEVHWPWAEDLYLDYVERLPFVLVHNSYRRLHERF